jgi:hypothetical protein
MKVQPPADIEDFEQVEEEYLRNRYENTRAPALGSMLKMADEWREAGCTPRFIIMSETPLSIACVAEETFGKYIN